MKRYGSAEWEGGFKEGKGSLTTESGALNKLSYSFKSRTEEGQGTNPEELIAVAHAGCFTMAFAAQLEKEGFKADRIRTTASVTLERTDGGLSIPAIHLEMIAKIPNISNDEFKQLANTSKVGCPVSKLMNADISLEAILE